MNKEELQKRCKYYGIDQTNSIFSAYEEKWIDLMMNDSEQLNSYVQYYIRTGLEHFNEHDNTPIGIKAILWNRYESHDLMPTFEGFADWYSRQYIEKSPVELIKYCRYYKGEKKNPFIKFGNDSHILWNLEKYWVNAYSNGGNIVLSECLDEYKLANLTDFCSNDSTHITYKALLFNRYGKNCYSLSHAADSFKKLYTKYYCLDTSQPDK